MKFDIYKVWNNIQHLGISNLGDWGLEENVYVFWKMFAIVLSEAKELGQKTNIEIDISFGSIFQTGKYIPFGNKEEVEH